MRRRSATLLASRKLEHGISLSTASHHSMKPTEIVFSGNKPSSSDSL
jgi:hypothetical protein